MKLYYHPASTTPRIVTLFAAESAMPMDMQVVDIFGGEHHREPFVSINPNRLVPVLEDDGMRLAESSAILKYLADKIGSPAYPKDFKQRARVNERMDGFDANFYKDYGYGLVYPQVLSHLAYPDAVAHKACVERGLEKTKGWLGILDQHLIGPKQNYLCGDRITIADYFGSVVLQAGKLVGCTLAGFPNVKRWMDRMRALRNRNGVHEAFCGFAGTLKGRSFVAV